MKIGILGGGQLARMLANAAYPLGIEIMVLDPSPEACAAQLSKALVGNYDDERLLAQLAEFADVVTYEFENVPAKVADFLAARTQVYPPARALEVAQDRLVEKNFIRALGIPTPRYAAVDNLDDLRAVMPEIGYPAVLKSRTMGYDGKGQSILKSEADLAAAWESLEGVAAIVEQFIKFDREVSIIAARKVSGEQVYYPLSENIHRGGILRIAESRQNDALQSVAEQHVAKLLEALGYVGVIALELFDVQGTLLVNEFAPRVHNSGHWTIEGSETSQFENHLRAILNLPLGSTAAVNQAAMVNFIGGLPSAEALLSIPQVHAHFYAKAPRKGRKVAHATVRSADSQVYRESLSTLAKLAESVDCS